MEKLRAPKTRSRHYGFVTLAVILGFLLTAATWDLSPSYEPPDAGGATYDLTKRRIVGKAPIADLKQIRWRRELRVLLPSMRTALSYSPDVASAHEFEIELVKRFAEKHYLEIDWVHVEH